MQIDGWNRIKSQDRSMGKEQSLQPMTLGQLDNHVQKNETGGGGNPYLTHTQKSTQNVSMTSHIHDLNIKAKTINLLREYRGKSS